MLSEQGIELGDAQVRKDNSSENGQNQQFAGDRNGHVGNGTGVNGDVGDEFGDATVIEQSVSRQMKGGIDFYAWSVLSAENHVIKQLVAWWEHGVTAMFWIEGMALHVQYKIAILKWSLIIRFF